MALFVFGISVPLFIAGIVLWVFSVKKFKNKKHISAIILAFVGLLSLTSLSYMIIRAMRSDYFMGVYTKEFTEIRYGFSEGFVHRKNPAGLNLEVSGNINGRGELLINGILMMELEGDIDEQLRNIDWYTPDILMEFIPENEFVDGRIMVRIHLY